MSGRASARILPIPDQLHDEVSPVSLVAREVRLRQKDAWGHIANANGYVTIRVLVNQEKYKYDICIHNSGGK